MSDARGDALDRFATRASDHGAELTRVPAVEATETIADLIDSPAVGVPLPFDDVDLPDGVRTEPTPADLDDATTGVTAAKVGVADYGTLVLEPTPDGSEPVSLFPDLHVAVLRERDIVPDMEAAFEWFGERCRDDSMSAILATGPSATADMGDLVLGAHGPKDVHVVVVR